MQIAHKKDIPQELVVKIEKLSNLGLGIAKLDGYVIFVENTCPEDEVKIRITKKNKNYANAVPIEVIKPSKYRCQPICAMQKVCGACQFGFIDYDYQLKLKKEIVEDVMKSIYGFDIEVRDVVPSPKITGYRRKIQYPVSETRDSKRILAGYYKQSSHELVNIKHCPIQPECCDEIIEYIRQTAFGLGVSGYVEKEHKGILRHVVIRSSSYNGENLVILVINSDKLQENVKELANRIYKNCKNIAGVGVNFNNKKTNFIMGKETEILVGESFVEEKLCDKVFKIGAGTFFQVNPESADNIFRYVRDYITENFTSPSILDAYAGIAAFGICLSDAAKTVTCVEECEASVELAKEIILENSISNIEIVCNDTAKFCSEKCSQGIKYDVTIIDPPRKGCTEESLDCILKLTKNKIIYVSCNPATLARDLKYLRNFGCKINYVQPFDMFPHTYHIENVAVIELP